jgi:hypothetical protein
MSNLEAILKSVSESVQVVEDADLRRIAFQEILKHALRSDAVAPSRVSASGDPSRPLSPKKKAAVSRQNSGTGIRPEAAGIDISPDEKKLVSWGTLSVDWKKFCWILEAARLKGLDGLTNAEISHLIDKVFRESYAPKVVNNIKFQIKKGMVKGNVLRSGDKDYQVWKILAAGIKEVSAVSSEGE